MMLDLVKIKMVDRSADQFCQNIQTTYLSDIYIAIITGESAQNQISIKHNNKSFFFSDWGLPTLKRHTGSKEVSPLGRPSFEFSSTFEFEEEKKELKIALKGQFDYSTTKIKSLTWPLGQGLVWSQSLHCQSEMKAML